MSTSQTVPFAGMTYKGLREAYVKFHFANPDVFANGNVEKWVDDEERAETPDASLWEEYFYRHALEEFCTGREAQILMANADPYSFRDGDLAAWNDTGEDLYALCDALDIYKTSVYKAPEIPPVIVQRNLNPPDIFRFYPSDPEETYEVLPIILSTWIRKGPKARRAREFLCDLMRGVILSHRSELQLSFDEAVAVSADGSEVSHAHRVILFSRTLHRGACHVYSNHHFQDDKLPLLASDFRLERDVNCDLHQFLYRYNGTHTDLKDILEQLLKHDIEQAEIRTDDKNRILFCHHKLLPTLPAGGLEIK